MEGSDFIPTPKKGKDKNTSRRRSKAAKQNLAAVDIYMSQVDRALADLKKAISDLKSSLN